MIALGWKFFFYCYGDHRDVHLSIRRQRQMCIRDSTWKVNKENVNEENVNEENVEEEKVE